MTELRCYEYLPHGYLAVREILAGDLTEVLHAGTTAASDRVTALSTDLHGKLGPIEIDVPVTAHFESFNEVIGEAPQCNVRVSWSAETAAAFFPHMDAFLRASVMTPTETKLFLDGRYTPPGGALGEAFDALLGHSLAEASVQAFLRRVARSISTAVERLAFERQREGQ